MLGVFGKMLLTRQAPYRMAGQYILLIYFQLLNNQLLYAGKISNDTSVCVIGNELNHVYCQGTIM